MKIATVGIDLAKNVFGIHGAKEKGRVVVRKVLSRRRVLEFLANLPKCLVGMEACASAHYWAREIAKQGHEVRLIAPRFVKPYVKANKNDASDAEAICEAVTRLSMRFVAIKTPAQLEVQALHRVRALLIKSHTASINQIRGLLAEHGIVIPRGRASLRRGLPLVLEDDSNGLSGLMRELISEVAERLKFLEQQLRQYDLRIQRMARQDESCRRLAEIAGVGPLTATALVAAVGTAKEFKSGRELAAYFGLVPGHRASGGHTVMLGISKRGDRYLRTLLVHGARAAVYKSERRRDAQSIWVSRLKLRRGVHVATVALANKNARVVWKLLTSGASATRRCRPARRSTQTVELGSRAHRLARKLAGAVHCGPPRIQNPPVFTPSSNISERTA
jgi:transposase